MDINNIERGLWVVQGRPISIEPMYLKQQILLNKYSNIASASRVIYENAIARENIDMLLYNFPDEARKFGAAIIKQILDTFVIDELVRAGDHTLSVENYFDKYYLRAMEDTDSLFLKAIEDVRKDVHFNHSLYNKAVRDNTEKFQNRIQVDALAGNGIVNAIKGAVTAYAINSVIDFASGFSTTMKNNAAYRSLEANLTSVKNSSKVYTSLVEGFWEDIRNCYIAEEYYWDDRNDYINYPDEEDQDKATAIVKNLKLGRIPQDEELTSIIKAIELNPFLSETYLYALEKYPNENAFIQVGKFFSPNAIEKALQNYFDVLCSNSNNSDYSNTLKAFRLYLHTNEFQIDNVEEIWYVKKYVNSELEKNYQKKLFIGIEFSDIETAKRVQDEYTEAVRLMQTNPEKLYEKEYKYIDLKKINQYLLSEVLMDNSKK